MISFLTVFSALSVVLAIVSSSGVSAALSAALFSVSVDAIPSLALTKAGAPNIRAPVIVISSQKYFPGTFSSYAFTFLIAASTT